jgi:hypothetical protein
VDLPLGKFSFRGEKPFGDWETLIYSHASLSFCAPLRNNSLFFCPTQGFFCRRWASSAPFRLQEWPPTYVDPAPIGSSMAVHQVAFDLLQPTLILTGASTRKKGAKKRVVLLHSPRTAVGNIQRCSSSRVYLPTVRCNGERAPSGNKIRCRIRTGPPIRPVWIHRSFVKRFPFQSWLDIIPLTTKAILGNLSECASQLRAPHNGRPRRLSA